MIRCVERAEEQVLIGRKILTAEAEVLPRRCAEANHALDRLASVGGLRVQPGAIWSIDLERAGWERRVAPSTPSAPRPAPAIERWAVEGIGECTSQPHLAITKACDRDIARDGA